MTCKRLGCCGGFLNFLIGYWNFGLIASGGSIVVAAVLIRSGSLGVNILVNDSDVMTDLLNWSKSSLEMANLVAIISGGVLMIMGMIGLIGACFTNRCFLVLFEIFAITIFIAHSAAFATALIKADELNESVKSSLHGAIFDINNHYGEYERKCRGLYKFSTFFYCCGVESAFEIDNAQDRETCCNLTYNLSYKGCNEAIRQLAKNVGLYSFIIPNAVYLATELFYIVATPFLIKRIGRRKD